MTYQPHANSQANCLEREQQKQTCLSTAYASWDFEASPFRCLSANIGNQSAGSTCRHPRTRAGQKFDDIIVIVNDH